MKRIFLCEDAYNFNRVYAKVADREKELFDKQKLKESGISDVEYIFSTWGMPTFTEEEIKEYLPKLKAVFYAAGSVRHFAKPFLSCGVKVFSAWQANAVPVVEYSVAQILLASKGYFYLSRICKQDYATAKKQTENFCGNYGNKVGILGFGAIGSKVVNELILHKADVYVFAPDLSEEKADELGVHKAGIEDIFENCDVISNHMANVPQTVGIINREVIGKLKSYSTFINTGRGAQVDEAGLIAKLEKDYTVTAVLDVTDPEPPEADGKLCKLPNVILTPHIAGSLGKEVVRMADYMFEEYERFVKGEACKYEVTLKMLESMA